jgi:hypothetical protein
MVTVVDTPQQISLDELNISEIFEIFGIGRPTG